MISKELFKELVLAGASTAKLTMAVKNMAKVVNDEDDIEFPDEVYEIANETYFARPLNHLISSIAGIVDTDKHPAISVAYLYTDTVSLFAFDNKGADHYLDLAYKFLYEPEEVVDELSRFEKTLPKDELVYVRSYLV